MSRIGKAPVVIPPKVEVKIDGAHVAVKGPLGAIARDLPGVSVELADGNVLVSPNDGASRNGRALWGLGRALLQNMVTGVSDGFTRVLEINGVGYRAEVAGDALVLNLGHSKPINFPVPEGVTVEVEKQTTVTLKAVDKELLGQTAAKIRSFRPPEPYKGKGVKYREEHIRRKAGKAAK